MERLYIENMVRRDSIKMYVWRNTENQDLEKDKEWIYMHCCQKFWSILPKGFNYQWHLLRGLQPFGLFRPTWLISIVNDFMSYHVILLSLLTFFEPSATSANITHQDRRLLRIRHMCPNHLSLERLVTLSISSPVSMIFIQHTYTSEN